MELRYSLHILSSQLCFMTEIDLVYSNHKFYLNILLYLKRISHSHSEKNKKTQTF